MSDLKAENFKSINHILLAAHRVWRGKETLDLEKGAKSLKPPPSDFMQGVNAGQGLNVRAEKDGTGVKVTIIGYMEAAMKSKVHVCGRLPFKVNK